MALEELMRNYIVTYLPANNHIKAIIVLVAFFVLAHVIMWISENIILKLTAKTKTKVDDLIVKKASKPLSLIILLVGLKLAINSYSYGIVNDYEIMADKIVYPLIILCIGFIISGILIILLNDWGAKIAVKTKSTMDEAMLPLIRRFIYIVILIITGLYVLDYWAIDIGPILASLGIAGIAVAFAMQNSLNNIFGGISLILDRSIKVGDWVKIDAGSQGQITGIIHDIGLRSTKIKTFDNEFIIIPNGMLSQSQIQNLVLPDPKCRGVVLFGVAYGSDLKKVARVAVSSTKGVKNICKDPAPSFALDNFGDFAINCKLFFFTDSYDQRFNAKQEIMFNLYNSLKKAKIEIPYPTRTLFMKKGK